MDWASKFVATTILWGVFSVIAFLAVGVGVAALRGLGALEGDPARAFQFAWGIGAYLTCGALATATTLVYGGFARIGPKPKTTPKDNPTAG